MPIIEANAVAKPIFVGNIPILHEIGRDAVVYVDPTDIEGIRNVIIRLKNDVNFRNDLIIKGKENIKRFSIDEIFQMYLKFYDSVIS